MKIEICDPRKKQEFFDDDLEFSSVKENYIVICQDHNPLKNYDFITKFFKKYKVDNLSLFVYVRDTFFNNLRQKISVYMEKKSINQYYYNHFEFNDGLIEELISCYKKFGGFNEWTFCGYKEENAKKIKSLKIDGEWPTGFDFLKHIELYDYIFHSNLDMSWWSIYFKDENQFDDFLQFIDSFKIELEK